MLLRDAVAYPAMAAMDGSSTDCGLLDRNVEGTTERPVSIRYVPVSCPLSLCESERHSDQRWLRCASIGMCSQISMPGVFVAMALNSPRTSSGASGFMSNV